MSSIKEVQVLITRIINTYEILMQRRDKETNKRLTEHGIEFNEKLSEWNAETEAILKQQWRRK